MDLEYITQHYCVPAIEAASSKWNESADEHNNWDCLGLDEKIPLIMEEFHKIWISLTGNEIGELLTKAQQHLIYCALCQMGQAE